MQPTQPIARPIYQVDAFASAVFRGNPAAVCPLDYWLDDAVMQAIAAENNLSETAFFVPSEAADTDFHIRWFTPTEEVDLCGHASLATAHVIFHRLGFTREVIRFHSLSGPLLVQKMADGFELNFPVWPLTPAPMSTYETMATALGEPVREVFQSFDWLVILEHHAQVAALKPDFLALAQLDCRGVIVSAPADPATGLDFVSRAFFPKLGINEDPVTGSAHCALIPYWAKRLGKTAMRAEQISARIGELAVSLAANDRVTIRGQTQLYLEGQYYLPHGKAA